MAVPVPSAEDAQFFEDFATAEGFFDRFQTEVFHGVEPSEAPDGILEWEGDHNVDCEGPTTHRTVHVDRHDEMFWWCAPKGPESGHVMTSMYTVGYAQVDFAPDEAFTDVKRVCWDQNMTAQGRKWTQVTVVPEALYQANDGRLGYVAPSLQNDVAVAGVHLEDDAFMLVFGNGSTEVFTGQSGYDSHFGGFNTEDKAKRYRNCMTDNEDGTITFVLQREGVVDTRTLRGAFPDGASRVIFQDDTYDAPKTDLGDRRGGDDPRATWHWDNIEIA